MILFFNVFITQSTLKHHYNRGHLITDDKLDVFKYAISSIAPIYQWSAVIIQFELDSYYAHRYDEITKYLKSLFPNQKNLHIRPKIRNTLQKHWQKTVEELDGYEDKVILFSCNHDHIFMDCQTEYFGQCVETFQKYQNEHSIMNISGYYEQIEILRAEIKQKPYWIDGPLVGRKWNPSDSFVIITKSLLREWWCSSVDFGDTYMSRTDGMTKANTHLMYNYFFTSRKLFAHYDGYQNIIHPQNIHYLKYDPPITIPKGYFDNDIKINFNCLSYNPNHVNINLYKENSSALVGVEGSDCFYLVPEEIPMAWQEKVSEIHLGEGNEWLDKNLSRRLLKIEEDLKFYAKEGTPEFDYFYSENERFLLYLCGKCLNFRAKTPIL